MDRKSVVQTIFVIAAIFTIIGGTVAIIQFAKPASPSSPVISSPSSNSQPSQSGTGNTPPPTQLTSIPKPSPHTILYQENGSDNWHGWTFSSDNASWNAVSNGLLVSVAMHRMSPGDGPRAIAPYSIDTTSVPNFEVIAVITTTTGLEAGYAGMETSFGITACGSTTSNGWQGYTAAATLDYNNGNRAVITRNYDELAHSSFDPGTNTYTYILEVRGNNLIFQANGGTLVQTSDDQYQTCGGQVGMYNGAATLHIQSFEVIAL